MAADIQVTPLGSRKYAVTIAAGGAPTTHHVTVPVDFAISLGVPPDDEPCLVRESFVFLLEHEPPTSILREFQLDVISRYFPDYESVLKTRLTE